MPTLTFINHQGREKSVEVAAGTTLMQAALDNLIDGIVAECGGSCACGTCHCYVEERWLNTMPPASKDETATLECALAVKPNSRLSCQVKLTAEMDGLIVRLPESQF